MLVAARGAPLVWLGWCMAQSAFLNADIASTVCVASSAVAVIGVFQAIFLEIVREERNQARKEAAEAVKRTEIAQSMVDEWAAAAMQCPIAREIDFGWANFEAACCLVCWSTYGMQHDPVNCDARRGTASDSEPHGP
ncbi:hypothetical protein [Streptomyces sp. NPDC017991]|uniref:hypothetical protein n=1 Tax=Streptomyces sp. NPDC017991 TaxID=3365026 RepID=UPI0037B688B1